VDRGSSERRAVSVLDGPSGIESYTPV
jgi:hypothetical protein